MKIKIETTGNGVKFKGSITSFELENLTELLNALAEKANLKKSTKKK